MNGRCAPTFGLGNRYSLPGVSSFWRRNASRAASVSGSQLGDRFLIVRGDKRTYKIHVGSGNILMEPNDQYLCIVPDSRARANDAQVYLPFEGDLTLSIILSKAFLLVEDTKIKDFTITRQIDGR